MLAYTFHPWHFRCSIIFFPCVSPKFNKFLNFRYLAYMSCLSILYLSLRNVSSQVKLETSKEKVWRWWFLKETSQQTFYWEVSNTVRIFVNWLGQTVLFHYPWLISALVSHVSCPVVLSFHPLFWLSSWWCTLLILLLLLLLLLLFVFKIHVLAVVITVICSVGRVITNDQRRTRHQ